MVQPARPQNDGERRAAVSVAAGGSATVATAGQDRPIGQAAGPTALHPVGPRPPGAPEHAAADWAIGAKEGGDDPLLASLVLLGELLERPTSAGRLVAGLPLEDGRLTPALALRAAARAGLAARLVRRPLERISDLTLPCILLLEGCQACVLVARVGGRAIVALPETGG